MIPHARSLLSALRSSSGQDDADENKAKPPRNFPKLAPQISHLTHPTQSIFDIKIAMKVTPANAIFCEPSTDSKALSAAEIS
jgi:hypothetical protein